MVNCEELKNRISAYQFALYDLGLFQDSHPENQQAMELRRVYRARLDKLIDDYEQMYGPLIQTQEDVEDSWKEWVNDPWPWEIQRGGR